MKLILKNRLPEANIQAEFYMRCKQENIPCLLEYKIKGARFDAVIHDGQIISHIVEIKSMTERGKARRLESPKKLKQLERYEQYGIPVIWIINLEGIDKAIDQIKGVLHG